MHPIEFEHGLLGYHVRIQTQWFTWFDNCLCPRLGYLSLLLLFNIVVCTWIYKYIYKEAKSTTYLEAHMGLSKSYYIISNTMYTKKHQKIGTYCWTHMRVLISLFVDDEGGFPSSDLFCTPTSSRHIKELWSGCPLINNKKFMNNSLIEEKCAQGRRRAYSESLAKGRDHPFIYRLYGFT